MCAKTNRKRATTDEAKTTKKQNTEKDDVYQCPHCDTKLKLVDKQLVEAPNFPREYWFQLSEDNDNEGENWNYYFGCIVQNKRQQNTLIKALDTLDSELKQWNGDPSTFRIHHPFDKRTVETVCKHSGHGYMYFENDRGYLPLGDVVDLANCAKCLGEISWYKGTIQFGCQCKADKQRENS